jgi:hypothetical protein
MTQGLKRYRRGRGAPAHDDYSIQSWRGGQALTAGLPSEARIEEDEDIINPLVCHELFGRFFLSFIKFFSTFPLLFV